MLVSWILPKTKQKILPRVLWYLRWHVFVRFWKNWRHQKIILKLTDLYQSSKINCNSYCNLKHVVFTVHLLKKVKSWFNKKFLRKRSVNEVWNWIEIYIYSCAPKQGQILEILAKLERSNLEALVENWNNGCCQKCRISVNALADIRLSI